MKIDFNLQRLQLLRTFIIGLAMFAATAAIFPAKAGNYYSGFGYGYNYNTFDRTTVSIGGRKG